MKLTYKDLFAVQEMLGNVWDLELSPRLFMKLRRLGKTLGEELKTFEPERLKLFNRHPRFIKDGMFVFPKPGEEGFVEFMMDYDEVFGMTVDITWENADLAAIEKKIEESKTDIPGKAGNSLLNVVEFLNNENKEKSATVESEQK